MATAEGTRRLVARSIERGMLHPGNARVLGRPGLACSALGFGAYRVGGGDKEAAHAAAIRAAIRAGVNVLDTSAHYAAGGGHGASERLIGRTVAEAIAAGEVARDELVVCTKVGHVARGVTPPDGSVSVSPHEGGSEDWHSIAPAFINHEVRESNKRMGTPPDFVLLHNPEYFLSHQLRQRTKIADAWDEMYERLGEAFRALEALCQEGLIGSGYGVSGNFLSCMFSTTGRANLYEALALDRVVTAAAEAAGSKDSHRFMQVQLPLNAIESAASIGRGGAVPEASEGDCTVASRMGLGVVLNRPLNAIPIPGVSSGDWGRSGASHVKLREAKPMGTVEALLKRILKDNMGDDAFSSPDGIPFQQMALRVALSVPSASCCLCGMRTEDYVQDAITVLKAPPLAPDKVAQSFQQVRAAMEELGGMKRGLW